MYFKEIELVLNGVNRVFLEKNRCDQAKQPPVALLNQFRVTEISFSPGKKLGLSNATNVESIPASFNELFRRRAANPAPPRWPVDKCKIFIKFLDSLSKVPGKILYSQ
jgi:hypothetical protein